MPVMLPNAPSSGLRLPEPSTGKPAILVSMEQAQPKRSRSQIFGDDASKTGTYFVYGTLLVGQRQFRAVDEALKAVLVDYPHEIKWSETRHLTVKVAFLSALMDRWPSLTYRCIVVPNTQIKQSVKGPDRAELKAKLVYKLLNGYAKTTLLDEPEFFVTLDKDEWDPEVQAITLNRAFLRDYGGNYTAFKVRAEHSHEHTMLQAVDLITGAVAWVWNGGLNDDLSTDANKHRLTLATLIAKRTRLPSFKPKGQPHIPQGDVRALGHYTVKQRQKGFRIFPMDLTKSVHWKGAKNTNMVHA